jgi:tetratricopeptide (TPR) repeat protein
MRTSEWKYVQAPKPELYDLGADPGERANVIDAHPKETRQLQAQLATVTGPKGVEKVRTALADKGTTEQLKSLGYLSGFAPREFELSGKGIDPKDRIAVLKLEHDAVGSPVKVPHRRRIELLTKAVGLDPTNPALYHHLGVAYEESGRYGEALKLYQTAIQRGVENAKLYSRIADLYLRQGMKEQAIAFYEKAGRINPLDPEAQNNLATAYLEKGRVAEAEQIFHWVVTNDEKYAPAHNGLGLVAIQKQNPAEARVHFERAVGLDPDLVEAQLNLGLIYKMSGDRARARACFEAFLAKAAPSQYGHIIPQVKEEIVLLR